MAPQVRKFKEDVGRFKELILYISQKCATDPKFDTIKLNKLMCFSDFLFYAFYGSPITGFEYEKLQLGPAPRRMPEMKKAMKDAGELGLQDLPLKPWRRTVNLRQPNLEVFTAQQVALVDQIIEAFKESDGDHLSLISHKMPCWIMPRLGETIPYEMVFLSDEEPTTADIERGRIVAKELGLLEQHAANA